MRAVHIMLIIRFSSSYRATVNCSTMSGSVPRVPAGIFISVLVQAVQAYATPMG